MAIKALLPLTFISPSSTSAISDKTSDIVDFPDVCFWVITFFLFAFGSYMMYKLKKKFVDMI